MEASASADCRAENIHSNWPKILGGDRVPFARWWRGPCFLRGIGSSIAYTAFALGLNADKRRVGEEQDVDEKRDL